MSGVFSVGSVAPLGASRALAGEPREEVYG